MGEDAIETTLDSRLKAFRILSMFERLSQGAVLNKRTEAAQFNVNEKTIQRDLDDIRSYFTEMHGHSPDLDVVYRRNRGGYILERSEGTWLTREEVLTISKVLLESRALSKPELTTILDKLINQTSPDQRQTIREIVRNEVFHYVSVQPEHQLFQKLWDLSAAVRERRILELTYRRVGASEDTKRILEPVGVMFSEYYFYLLAYIRGRGYEFPTVYRVDRITNYAVLREHFYIPEIERFEEGEFRKRVQFMQTGKLLQVEFRFWGTSLESILDRLPTAQVIRKDERGTVIRATVYGRGIKMWLLSQAQYVEVLSPSDFRTEMQQTISEMLNIYST